MTLHCLVPCRLCQCQDVGVRNGTFHGDTEKEGKKGKKKKKKHNYDSFNLLLFVFFGVHDVLVPFLSKQEHRVLIHVILRNSWGQEKEKA